MMRAALLLTFSIALVSCATTRLDRETYEPDSRDLPSDGLERGKSGSWERASENGLQAHLLGGDVVVFDSWIVTEATVEGVARRYDAYRNLLESGVVAVTRDSVAIFVADRRVPDTRSILGKVVFTGASVALTAFCLTQDKACFGSCPTFYVPGEAGEPERLVAEGYSASISPSLSDRDVDRLGVAHAGGPFKLRMTNEALETHVTRRADVLAVPTPPGGTVFFEGHGTGDGDFWQATAEQAPALCVAAEGDCLGALAHADGVERGSPADSTDLGAKETVTLGFTADGGARHGLVLTGRQSLLTTFLVYQGLAYAGSDIGGWIAQGETRARAGVAVSSPIVDLVTDIPVEVRAPGGSWTEAGVVHEVGPLARDAHLVVLPELPAGPVEVRLRPTRGAWRLDAARMVTLGDRVTPVRVAPSSVLREAADGTAAPAPDALAELTNDARSLVTLPGTALQLGYAIPEATSDGGWTLFLEAEGYYLEWMRDEWMAERDPDALAEMLYDPETALRRLAPAFKAMEAEMDAAFWGSRFVAPAAAPLVDF